MDIAAVPLLKWCFVIVYHSGEGGTDKPPTDTLSPFGRAFYNGEANYVVLPLFFHIIVNILAQVTKKHEISTKKGLSASNTKGVFAAVSLI